MSEVSNGTIVALLAVALVVSVAGTVISINKVSDMPATSLTGAFTNEGTGTTNFNVSQVIAIDMKQTAMDFGTGSVNSTEGNEICMMSSGSDNGLSSPSCLGDWETTTDTNAFLIENTGNDECDVAIKSSATAADFIGGTSPAFKYKGVVGTDGAEASSCGTPREVWTALDTTDKNVCGGDGMPYASANDLMGVRIRLEIPSDVSTAGGQRSATLTFTATASS